MCPFFCAHSVILDHNIDHLLRPKIETGRGLGLTSHDRLPFDGGEGARDA